VDSKPIQKRTWFVATICIVALFVTWAAYFAVYDALPNGTPLAHWGLFVLALGSTAGLLITLEHALPGRLAARFPSLNR
jgi:hypothetical protein